MQRDRTVCRDICHAVLAAACAVVFATAAVHAGAAGADCCAPGVTFSGQVNYGVSYRLEAPDPALLNVLNAAASGQRGLAPGGQNSDDGDTNFQRHDATASVLKGYADLNVAQGPFSMLLRARAWRDFALRDGARPFGNSANGYTAGAPLSDAGAPARTRFSGALLSDYYLQYDGAAGGQALRVRVGQQLIPWGNWAGSAGGISIVNGTDLPGLRRPGSVPQESKVAAPAVFAHAGLGGALAAEAYVQTAFKPAADDMCGTFGAISDYIAPGCDKVMAGLPAASDRQRVRTGQVMQRLPMAAPDAPSQHGLALLWHDEAGSVGLYHARLASRNAFPGLQTSTRVGAPLVAGDPDGKNMRFFTEYIGDIDVSSLALARRVGTAQLTGELSYRAGNPLMISPSDVLPAFLSPTAPSLMRADANRLGPGGLFHGSDRYHTVHATLALDGDLGAAAGLRFGGGADLVYKHVIGLPDPAVRRYGRADQYGAGPINGACTPSVPAMAAIQCSETGYVTATAWGARVHVEARTGALAPGLETLLSLALTDDVKGWSYDNIINEGRKRAMLVLRLVYRQRYLAELMATPNWGGQYNAQSDRDLLSLSLGIRF